MNIEKIGVVNSSNLNQVGFGNEASTGKISVPPSDNNGAKFFAVAAGIAAVAAAGIAISKGKKVKNLTENVKKLTGDVEKLTGDIKKMSEETKNGLTKNTELSGAGPKLAETPKTTSTEHLYSQNELAQRALESESKPIVKAMNLKDANDIVATVEHRLTAIEYEAKQAELENTFGIDSLKNELASIKISKSNAAKKAIVNPPKKIEAKMKPNATRKTVRSKKTITKNGSPMNITQDAQATKVSPATKVSVKVRNLFEKARLGVENIQRNVKHKYIVATRTEETKAAIQSGLVNDFYANLKY